MTHRVIECRNKKKLLLSEDQWQYLVANIPSILGAMYNSNYMAHLGCSLFVSVIEDLSVICFQQWVDEVIDDTWYLSFAQFKEFQIYALYLSHHFDDCTISEEVFEFRINCAPYYEIVRWDKDDVIYLVDWILDDNSFSKNTFSFPLYRWKAFEQVIDMKLNYTQRQYHVGGRIYVHVLPPNTILLVEDDHEMHFTYNEWSTLSKHVRHVSEICSDMESVQPCHMDHHNQLAYLQCPECHPNPFEDLPELAYND